LDNQSVRKTRLLIGKVGLDEHGRGVKVTVSTLRDIDFEVNYADLKQMPESMIEPQFKRMLTLLGVGILSGAY
jgi:methylmalonyl-CoA mutase cobalamin-binding domain/chain